MAGEQVEKLPDELRIWLEERADSDGTDAETVLARAVTLYRLVDERAADESAPTPEALLSEVDSVSARLADVEADFDEKLQDVRQRVVQVKREADAKAPSDHGHPDLSERLDHVSSATTELRSDLDDVDGRVETGFENYEEVLEYLTEETEGLDEKLTRLASTVVGLRRRAEEIETELATQDAVADLRETANRHGDERADCAACGNAVHIGLLSRPHCPHCEATFVDVDPSGRFFGRATLTTGALPALTAGEDASPPEPTLDDHPRSEDDE